MKATFICEWCGSEYQRHNRTGERTRFCSLKCRYAHVAAGGLKGTIRRKWKLTPHQTNRIRQVYLTGTGSGQVLRLAKELGVPRHIVSNNADKMGLLAKKKRQPAWSEDEKKILEGLARYSLSTIQRLMAKRGYRRTVSSIRCQLTRQRALQNLKGGTASDLAECLGVDNQTVVNAIRAGKLKAQKRGTDRTAAQGGDEWWIMPKSVFQYIGSYLEEVDFRKIDKYWLHGLLTDKKLNNEKGQSE
jgi:Mn-dependent DtxR family transcriptional regulator